MITNKYCQCVGIAFRDIDGDFYPMIGLNAFNETVEANFGQDEFVFDVVKYAKVCKKLYKLREYHGRTY